MDSNSFAKLFSTCIFLSLILPTISSENEFVKNDNNTYEKQFMKKFSKFIFSPEAKVHSECIADFTKFYLALRNKKEIWPFQMLDSWGKIPSGIGTGNIQDFGQFEQCLDINEKNVKGKYCTINFPINLGKMMELLPQSDTNRKRLERIDKVEKYIGNVTKTDDKSISGLAYKMGICIPHKCSVDFVKKVLPWALDIVNVSLDFTIQEKYCVTDEPQKWETIDYVAISIFGFFAILMLISTVYDLMTKYFSKKEITNRYHSLYISFSLWTNTIKIISTDEKAASFKCFNGLKSLSMLWIMLGHSMGILILFPQVNMNYVLRLIEKYTGAFIMGGRFSTDTFFVLGGCLLGYSALKKYNKVKNIDIVMFYVYRIIRLTPAFAAVILFYVSLLKFMGDGPLWHEIIHDLISICDKQWWAALIYIQNYIDPKIMCVNQSWYLCADMQLYILSPLLIYPLLRWKKLGMLNMALWIIVSQIVVFAIAFQHKFIAAVVSFHDVTKRVELFDFATHTRATPWLMGFALGYFLYLKAGTNLKIHKLAVVVFWALSMAILIACSLAMKSLMDEDHEMSFIEDTMFLAFAKTGWSAAIIWIVIACIFGYGGPINWFLSLRIWEVFSRLTYSIYLIHFIPLYVTIASFKQAIFLSDNQIFILYITNVFECFIGAYILAMMFEYPIMNITSIIFTKKKKPEVTQLVKVLHKVEKEAL